jgi:hypothetical protein
MNNCESFWHTIRLAIRAPRCPSCGEIHPDGIVIEGEYLKMISGKPYTVTYQDREELRDSEVK